MKLRWGGVGGHSDVWYRMCRVVCLPVEVTCEAWVGLWVVGEGSDVQYRMCRGDRLPVKVT